MPAASLITLLTDFGVQDTYVAQMKGVILGLNPNATIVDVTHAIAPQDVFHGAICFDEAFDAFPPGTIHVVVVDPGVGSARRRIGVELGGQRFVGPDNGLLSLVARRYPVRRVHELVASQFHRQPVSPTFHGRDIFSPVAAYWSLGEDLSHFGPPVDSSLVELQAPKITRFEHEIVGQIIAIDRFGNLISNITQSDLPSDSTELVTQIAGRRLQGLNQFYAQQPHGAVLVLLSSGGRLEIARNGGSASQILQVGIGERVHVSWHVA
ncbi:MAG: hypothetical protein JWM11_4251 [Planctomycetaceae bacterium]|nr:hypothetical protein [Planctomycetaceae bacterium]